MQLKQILIGAALTWATLASSSGAGAGASALSHASLLQPAAQVMHMHGYGAAPVNEAQTWLMMGFGVALMAGGLALMRSPTQRPTARFSMAV